MKTPKKKKKRKWTQLFPILEAAVREMSVERMAIVMAE